MNNIDHSQTLKYIGQIERQVYRLEQSLSALNTKLQRKQKLLKDLQTYQNLVNLLHYNLLSKENNVQSINQRVQTIIEQAPLVLKKIPNPITAEIHKPKDQASLHMLCSKEQVFTES